MMPCCDALPIPLIQNHSKEIYRTTGALGKVQWFTKTGGTEDVQKCFGHLGHLFFEKREMPVLLQSTCLTNLILPQKV